jgi:hypothetical protein
METNYWRKCAACAKEIPYKSIYQKCSVSTCSKMVFCSVDCWDTHVPLMNHKNAWAEEEVAPVKSEVLVSPIEQPVRRIVVSPSGRPPSQEQPTGKADETEILIVASKLKQYVKDKYDLNTSGNVMVALSREVRRLTDRAVEKARAEGRKTLMDRDF